MKLCMGLVLVCLVIASVVTVTNAAVAQSSPSKDPAHAGKCFNPDAKTLHKVGEVYTDKSSCTRISCHSDFSMSWESCGAIGGLDGCEIVAGDTTQDYPGCCSKIKC